MIEVRASVVIYADDDDAADAVLKALLVPVKGAAVHVVEAYRESFQ